MPHVCYYGYFSFFSVLELLALQLFLATRAVATSHILYNIHKYKKHFLKMVDLSSIQMHISLKSMEMKYVAHH